MVQLQTSAGLMLSEQERIVCAAALAEGCRVSYRTDAFQKMIYACLIITVREQRCGIYRKIFECSS
jgi:hypothetical protein